MADGADSEFVQIVAQTFTFDYVVVALTSLVVYDYLITLDQEVATVWNRKFNATSCLLVTTRWVMLLNQIFTWIPGTPNVCGGTEITSAVFLTVAVVQIALFSALRVFALWDRNYVLSAIVFLLSFVPVGADMYTWIHSSYYYVGAPFYQCSQTLNYSDELDIDLTYLSRSCLIAADTIVLACTWSKTFRQYRYARRINMTSSITKCLLRDGNLVFLLILNIIQIVTFNSTSAPLGPFISTIPSILVSRFIMNLRQAGTPAATFSTPDSSALPSAPAFVVPPSYIGAIGGDLDHDGSLDVRGSVTL
ncbi:hypothetical protein PHLGIDRAFT_26538 [Phlebiopsis gigantea 11061_1 CR5-6]|uniref:DUF6533 domain-containing protein n=1 Tax=Phlebiopsis gigantea (strain 11061_1 CR5-6) TaxID=745531 RepID=A0A0C3NDE4_PHLG1|nr:hypothetical protein PHLGIDRAFT_26538 [Phlebiopsis gigantea 11061_1 CR5-6]